MSEFSAKSVGAAGAAAVGLALAFGTTIIATFSIFMLEMSQEFGWGRAKVSGLLTVAALCQAPLSLIVGRLIDRYGVRRIVLPGIIVYGLSVMALSLADGSMAMLYALFAMTGVASSLVTMLPYSKVVTGWFNLRRGLMLSLYAVLAALLGSLVPQLARVLIDAVGWREGYLGLGIVVIAVGFPALFFFLHEPPRPAAARPGSATAEGMTAREVRRTPTYWLIIAAVALCGLSVGAVHAHMAPLLIGKGLSKAGVTNVLSLYTLASTGAQLAMGLLLDRFRTPRVAVPALALSLVGLMMMHLAPTPGVAIAGGVVLGASVGAETSLAKYLHARYFGVAVFGEIFSIQFLFISLSAGFGPVLMGLIYDRTGGYGAALPVFEGLIALGVLLISLLPAYEAVTRRRVAPEVAKRPHAAPGLIAKA